MPHVETSDQIERGATFAEFALRCACMFLHDTTVVKGGPLGVRIPKTKPSSYHRYQLAKAKKRLKRLEQMSARRRLHWAAKEADKAFRSEQAEHQKSVSGKVRLMKKYETMLAKIKAWKPPTPDHSRLKVVMREQIKECIDDLRVAVDVPKRKTPKQFVKDEMQRLKRGIAYHAEHLGKEIEGVKGRNQWVETLTKNLVSLKKAKV
jgi:hypothetical protein